MKSNNIFKFIFNFIGTYAKKGYKLDGIVGAYSYVAAGYAIRPYI
jgi:hypothetical protein